MKNDNKLLKALNEGDFESASVRELVKGLYMQLIQSQILEIELKSELVKTNKKLAVIEKALSSSVFMRSGFLTVRYDFRTSEIIIAKDYRIDFSNTIENDLLKKMFFIKTGKPRPTKWQASELAASFNNRGIDSLDDYRKVYKAARRIKERLQTELDVDLLYLKGKEFFWFYTD